VDGDGGVNAPRAAKWWRLLLLLQLLLLLLLPQIGQLHTWQRLRAWSGSTKPRPATAVPTCKYSRGAMSPARKSAVSAPRLGAVVVCGNDGGALPLPPAAPLAAPAAKGCVAEDFGFSVTAMGQFPSF
jgi:hypothetical protein